LVWGAADFLGGLKSRQLQLLSVLLISQAAGLVAVVVAAAVRGEGPPAEVVPWAIANGITGTVSLAAFYRALAVGAMGVVAPISASAAAIPVAVGVIGGERPAALQLAGIAVAIVGVAVASYEPPGKEEHKLSARTSSGVGLALVAAVGFGLFFVGLDEGSDHDLLWTLVIGRTVSTSMLVAVALAMRPRLRLGPGDTTAVVAVGLLDMGANALFAAATTLGLVSVVSVLGSLYPVTTLVLARFLLGERLHASQRGGAVAALVGVALISAG
ncbi:MAG TPA: DMT family transporter, partial [Thermoleophilaceae bacterium]|nr:DMT family transporter [Thermoleophilaceae bacterium]